jgi:hypothetical protein
LLQELKVATATEAIAAVVRHFEKLARREQLAELGASATHGIFRLYLSHHQLKELGPTWKAGGRRDAGADEERAAAFSEVADERTWKGDGHERLSESRRRVSVLQ